MGGEWTWNRWDGGEGTCYGGMVGHMGRGKKGMIVRRSRWEDGLGRKFIEIITLESSVTIGPYKPEGDQGSQANQILSLIIDNKMPTPLIHLSTATPG